MDDDYDDMLWIRLTNKVNDGCLNLCVCYNAPATSPYCKGQDYFDTLLGKLYVNQTTGDYIIGGDFNARMGDLPDYIEGSDDIQERNVIDDIKNTAGDNLANFLIQSDSCVLNGRAIGTQDFTVINNNGKSEVDYIIIPKERYRNNHKMEVLSPSTIVNQANIKSHCKCKVDHSLLWMDVTDWMYNAEVINNTETTSKTKLKTKYDVSEIPGNFMNNDSCKQLLLTSVNALKLKGEAQDTIDNIYNDFVTCLKNEMENHLPKHTLIINNHRNYKKPKANKPWWDTELTEKWKEQCEAERMWKKQKDKHNKKLHNNFIGKRKEFDRLYQKKRRQWMKKEKDKLCALMSENSRNFWKQIDKIGIGNERRKIPGDEVKLDNGYITTNEKEILQKWKNDFKSLFAEKQCPNFDSKFLKESEILLQNYDKETKQYNKLQSENDTIINSDITYEEVYKAVYRAKLRKASGIDEVPTEVLRNSTVISYLTKLFQQCFKSGLVPDAWKTNIITPISKGASTDPLVPLTHRGLHLLSSICKVYCDILNTRLNTWIEQNKKLAEEQNGFRQKRNCLDHLYVLTSIAKDRLQHRKQLYCCYVDAKKAFDSVNRTLLWSELINQGINGPFLGALRALYNGYQCCVKIQGSLTERFGAPLGVKQGCKISPSLFGLYINSLAEIINNLNMGASYDGRNIGILMYADDVVLISETADGLQKQLDILNNWCNKWQIELNSEKTSVMIFRNKNTDLPSKKFICGEHDLKYIEEYKYLGLYLNSNMNWSKTVDYLAKSASKALGVIIAKDKAFGGMDYATYTHLYNTCIRPILEYGSELWGVKRYSSIDSVWQRAMKYHLKLGQTSSSDAAAGDMGWTPPIVRNDTNRIRYYCKLKGMDIERLPNHVFRYQTRDVLQNNWRKSIETIICTINEERLLTIDHFSKYAIKNIAKCCTNKLTLNFEKQWSNRLFQDNRPNAVYGNKLRTYRKFKNTYKTEDYLKMHINCKYRKAYIKFRAGVAPINIELLRYANNRYVQPSERLCDVCDFKQVEDETHLLCHCPAYNDIRESLYGTVRERFNNFDELTSDEKFVLLMSNVTIFKPVAKSLFFMLLRRNDLIYVNNIECVNNHFNTDHVNVNDFKQSLIRPMDGPQSGVRL